MLAAACASAPDAVNAAPDSEAAGQAAGEALVLEPLAESALPPGECGMVLWTLDENRPTPIFRYVAGKQAEIALDGARVKLARTDQSGASGFGVFERQEFSAADGMKVAVEAKFSLGFDGGSYLERGLVTVETPGGWRTVAPAAGLAGCRSK